MLTLASAKLTGIPGEGSWSQVFEFRGELFGVIASDSPVPEIAGRLEREYFGHPDLKPFNALKLAVERVSGEFPGVEIAAISFIAGVIYSAATGGPRVLISREGALATILASKVGEIAAASGFPKERDMMLLATSSFFQRVPQENIKIGLQAGNPTAAAESFLVGKDATIVIKFEEEGAKPEVIQFPVKVSLLQRIKKFLPERKIYIKPRVDFQTTTQAKKTTLLVGVILLVILAVSIGFGIRQKNVKEKAAKEAQEEQRLKDLEAAGHFSATPELFLDLTLLSSGFKGDVLSTSGENLFILDKNGKRVVSVEIATKKSKVVAGAGKLEEAFELAAYEDRVFVLASDGINEVSDEVASVIEKDWGEEVFIHAFARNLYVLDKSASAIYRYAGSDDSFGSRQNWLSVSTKPDFGGAKSWTFDGAIYVLLESGRVLKFSQGSPQAFSLPSEVTLANAIFANDENEFLYILDKTGKKVVVTGKSGEFKAQYSSDQISDAISLVASEAERKILLLTGGKLLLLEMKHL